MFARCGLAEGQLYSEYDKTSWIMKKKACNVYLISIFLVD